MTSFAAKRNPDRCPTHPGALLRDDILPAVAKPKIEIAEVLGISAEHLYVILREDYPVPDALAVQLGKMFGNGPIMWTRMQAAYDAWHG